MATFTDQKITSLTSEQQLVVDTHLPHGLSIRGQIFFLSSKFVEYQKDLIQDFVAELIDTATTEDFIFAKFKKYFEFSLQELNSKLAIFAEKSKDLHRFDIRWSVELIYEHEYVASLIGSVSMLIFRHNKLYYLLHNESLEKNKIDLFTDFIEWDVHHGDEIIVTGVSTSSLIDDEDLEEVNTIAHTDGTTPLQSLSELLKNRVSSDQLPFLTATTVHHPRTMGHALSSSHTSFSWILSKIKWSDWTSKWSEFFFSQKYLIALGVCIVIIFFTLVTLISSYFSNKKWITIISGIQQINFSIEDIKKEIDYFKRLDPAAEEKITKYNAIIAKIKLLEDNKKLPNDVAELKKILNEEYAKGFNITTISNLIDSQYIKKIYDLTETDLKTIGKPLSVNFGKNNLNIGGTAGAVIGGVSNDVRWSAVSYGLSTLMKWCNGNLLRNGIYCFDATNTIYNLTKWWLETLTTKSEKFVSGITDVVAYGNSNMYIATNDPNLTKNNTYIVRYSNLPGSQKDFKEATPYSLPGSGSIIYNGFGDMAIDGTFLMRSQIDNKLYQFRRAGSSMTLNQRVVPLKGGDSIGEKYSNSGMQVFSFPNSIYVYLRDRPHNTLTAYKSTPLKNNDSYTTNYTLGYVFRIKFDLWANPIIDMTITDGAKPELYILMNKGIYDIKLYEYIDGYNNLNTTASSNPTAVLTQ